jgi:hypothetical protein
MTRLNAISYVVFGVVFLLSLHIHATRAGETSSEDQQIEPQDRPETQQHPQTLSTKIKHIDLGEGIESNEYTETEGTQIVSRVVKTTRDGELLCTDSSVKKLGQGVRMYYHNGKPVLGEVYNKDGIVEMLILVSEDGMPTEVFERKADGSTLPVGKNKLEQMKSGVRVIFETFGPVAEAVRKRENRSEIKKKIKDSIDRAKKESEKGARGGQK